MPCTYRVIKFKDDEVFSEQYRYGIVLDSWAPDASFRVITTEHETPCGETLDDLKADLQDMLEACEEPVLESDEIDRINAPALKKE